MDAHLVFQTLPLLFILATLGESGLRKCLDFAGNRAYFEHQFKNSPLASLIGLLFPIVLLMEIGSAGLAVAGLFQIWSSGEIELGRWAIELGCLNFITLLFGQRMAKDYAGAAGIVPYLAVGLMGLHSFF